MAQWRSQQQKKIMHGSSAMHDSLDQQQCEMPEKLLR